jgi:ADP-dependent NAD(P)H-hydrate dehydratase / NAD(P)H-hydrate epimerase
MTRTIKKWTARDAAKCVITPSDLDHKYSRGVLGVITGSAQYPGAAVLTTSAAAATGIGMIRFHSSSGLAHLVLHASPPLVCFSAQAKCSNSSRCWSAVFGWVFRATNFDHTT